MASSTSKPPSKPVQARRIDFQILAAGVQTKDFHRVLLYAKTDPFVKGLSENNPHLCSICVLENSALKMFQNQGAFPMETVYSPNSAAHFFSISRIGK